MDGKLPIILQSDEIVGRYGQVTKDQAEGSGQWEHIMNDLV